MWMHLKGRALLNNRGAAETLFDAQAGGRRPWRLLAGVLAIVFLLSGTAPAWEPAHESGGPLPPPDPPHTLFAAAVNAFWAANHPEIWRNLGVDGLLIEGVVFDPMMSIWSMDGDPASFGEKDALLKEVRAAATQLEAAGLLWNFVHCPLDPARPWMADPGLQREAIARFEEIGLFCRLAGVRGIALDMGRQNPMFDLRWDGYPQGEAHAARLKEGAMDFGRHLVRAVIRAFPAAEFVVLADDPVLEGPLWLPMFEGMLEGFGAARDLRLHLLVRHTADMQDPAELIAEPERMRRYFAARLSPENYKRWTTQCTWGAGLAPLGRDATFKPIARLAPPVYRVQRAAAKLASGAYLWIESDSQEYWRVNSAEAASYLGLLQLGYAPAGQNAELLPGLAEYGFRDPVDYLCRTGFGNDGEFVLQDESGAYRFLLASEGQLPAEESAPLLDLGTGESVAGQGRGAIMPQTRGPAVLEGPLPIVPYAVAASLWLQPEVPLTAGDGRVRIHFGFRNPLATTIAGQLDAIAPEGLSIGAASFPVHLDP
ncbi:MAG: hypothetical protein IT368_09580, partial [Candidatus Hydrogenedentes bacterium]|nr:hypothetical protein [Candidatus Hydrogenedentota bacterium]